MSRAFHSETLAEIIKYGIEGKILVWIDQFLLNEFQIEVAILSLNLSALINIHLAFAF